MPALYEHLGIRFLYPENWSLVDEEREAWPRGVTVQSEETSFFSLHVYPAKQPMGEIIDAVIETIREEYPDLEILEAKEKVGDVPAQGVDICFFFLDLLVEAKIRAVQTPTYTLVWHYQAESKEFEKMEPVFQAIATSLMQTQVAKSREPKNGRGAILLVARLLPASHLSNLPRAPMSTLQEATVPPQDAKRPLFLGLDVGGTNIKLGVVDDEGRVVGKTHIVTQEEAGPQDAVTRARQATEEMLHSSGLAMKDLAAVCLATPGTMDIPQGVLLQPHNLPHWYNFPIKKCVADAFRLPVSYANDANAAAYGEFWVGSGKAYHSIVLLTLGTGVGGGIIIGDLSVDGENSHGSECGHIIIDNSPTARMCGCGQTGHLEAYCSATALVKRAWQELNARIRKTTLAGRVAKGEELTALMISEEAELGDTLSSDLIQELATWLGLGIVTLMHTIDPGAVILGGAMNFGGHDAPVGKKFIERVRAIVKKHAFPIPAQRTTIDFATLGGDAGFIGAAGIARIEFHRKK